MKVKTSIGIINANKDTLLDIELAFIEAEKSYKYNGLNSLASNANKVRKEIYDARQKVINKERRYNNEN